MRYSCFQRLRPLLLLAVVLLCAAQSLFAQAPAWQDATSPGAGYSASTTVDAAGNTYVTGTFIGTATFGATTLTSAGRSDVFVAKRNPAGVWEWATRAGGSDDDRGNGVAVDSSGSVVVTGTFASSTISFGATTLTNAGLADIFIAKLMPTGTWQWATGAGGGNDDRSNDVAVDGRGNVVVTGEFASPTITFGATTFTNAGNYHDLFVAKLTPAGAWLWATRAGGSEYDGGTSVAVDGSGSVVVTGSFNSPTLPFGATTLTNTASNTPGEVDLFVAKLTPTGAWQWATSAGGNYSDIGFDVAVDGSGSVIVSGGFSSTNFSLGATIRRSEGGFDLFVAKLTPTGVWQWVTSAGGVESDYAYGVAVDSSGSVVVTGEFGSSTITFGATTLTSAGSTDVFVAKLTPTGVWQWATGTGGVNRDYGFGVAIAGSGSVVVTGVFQSPAIAFGATTLTNPSPGYEAIFLARLSSVTGLPDEAAAAGLGLWPNPAHGTVRLSSPAPGPVQLLDALGRVVCTSPLAPGTSNLDLSGLPPGLYTVRTSTQARRLVVE